MVVRLVWYDIHLLFSVFSRRQTCAPPDTKSWRRHCLADVHGVSEPKSIQYFLLSLSLPIPSPVPSPFSTLSPSYSPFIADRRGILCPQLHYCLCDIILFTRKTKSTQRNIIYEISESIPNRMIYPYLSL